MKTAQELYRQYNIMPSLQLHQLRVAAVGKTICDNFKQPINTRDVILACLFHDMGNIIKSDLTYFPQFVEPEGVEYWGKVKADFIAKYGAEHHRANVAIVKEISIPASAVALIDSIGFSKVGDVVADPSYERKVLQYADMRVGPHGVLPLVQRLREGRERYTKTRTARTYHESDKEFEKLLQTAITLEKQISSRTVLAVQEITDATIGDTVEELRKYPTA